MLFGLTFYEVTPLYNNEFVGPPRLELGTSASKADVLTNYTAYPNRICREAQIRTGIAAVSGRKPNLLADLPINKLFNYHLAQCI